MRKRTLSGISLHSKDLRELVIFTGTIKVKVLVKGGILGLEFPVPFGNFPLFDQNGCQKS